VIRKRGKVRSAFQPLSAGSPGRELSRFVKIENTIPNGQLNFNDA